MLPGAAGGMPVPSGWPASPWCWGFLPIATPPVGRRSGRRRRWRWFRPAWGGVRFALEFYRVDGAPVKVPRRVRSELPSVNRSGNSPRRTSCGCCSRRTGRCRRVAQPPPRGRLPSGLPGGSSPWQRWGSGSRSSVGCG